MFRLNGGDTMIQDGQLLNYIAGKWQRSRASEFLDVRNPATAETMVRVPLSLPDEVDEAVHANQAAFPAWRRTLPVRLMPSISSHVSVN
jgi:malonate-semialdehyde dehydrogenase (acetylating) / methylmalonate-semialdehyde dehydrogenase